MGAEHCPLRLTNFSASQHSCGRQLFDCTCRRPRISNGYFAASGSVRARCTRVERCADVVLEICRRVAFGDLQARGPRTGACVSCISSEVTQRDFRAARGNGVALRDRSQMVSSSNAQMESPATRTAIGSRVRIPTPSPRSAPPIRRFTALFDVDRERTEALARLTDALAREDLGYRARIGLTARPSGAFRPVG